MMSKIILFFDIKYGLIYTNDLYVITICYNSYNMLILEKSYCFLTSYMVSARFARFASRPAYFFRIISASYMVSARFAPVVLVPNLHRKKSINPPQNSLLHYALLLLMCIEKYNHNIFY